LNLKDKLFDESIHLCRRGVWVDIFFHHCLKRECIMCFFFFILLTIVVQMSFWHFISQLIIIKGVCCCYSFCKCGWGWSMQLTKYKWASIINRKTRDCGFCHVFYLFLQSLGKTIRGKKIFNDLNIFVEIKVTRENSFQGQHRFS